MKTREDARWDYLEWIKSGDCKCCFPHWKYDGVTVQDMWRWQEEPDIAAWIKFFDEMSEKEWEKWFNENH